MDGDIHSRYLKACKKVGLEPISCVLDACKTGTGTLSLSGNCLSIDTCKILAKILLSGHQFCELDLSDCLIGDEGENGSNSNNYQSLYIFFCILHATFF